MPLPLPTSAARRSRLLRAAAFLACALLAALLPRSGAQSPRLITGRVLDPSGAALDGVTVQLFAPSTPAPATPLASAVTHRGGLFELPVPAPGAFRLVLSSPAFQPRSVAVDVPAGDAPPPLRIQLALQTVLTNVDVQGREDDLTGIATSATQGTVGARELRDRPLLRSGEVLEALPGLLLTQHAGGGKANQYFLRGFNLDHGTDFAVFLDGMPLNLPSHAHGEGYADMNTVIPELVRRIDFAKGPYDPAIGNFGAAGAAKLEFVHELPSPLLKLEGGMYGYGRLVFAGSRPAAAGTLLLAAEAEHDDGPWTHKDHFLKLNALASWTHGTDAAGLTLSARAYRGVWHSSDQIPVTAIPLVGEFGTLNPTDGGRSQRYSLQGDWHRTGAASLTRISAFGAYYDLDLFSDFTYFLIDPIRGDQFEQQDRRWIAGLDARHTLFSSWLGRRASTTVGLQLRRDWVHNGLFRTQNRLRTTKVDTNACNDDPIDACLADPSLAPILPAATDLNRFSTTLVSGFVESQVQWAPKLRSVLGLRADAAFDRVTSLTPTYTSNIPSLATPVDFARLNSGVAHKLMPEPKLSLIAGPWAKTEFYAQAGISFHSNDARGATQHAQPISPDSPFPADATPVPALVPLKGAELGIRTSALPGLRSTLSLWYLHSGSELQQSGDTGSTTPSASPSDRYGVEWANFYTPAEHLTLDLDLADSRALFTDLDPDDAAYTNPSPANGLAYPEQLPGGRLVPEAVRVVASSGITLHELHGFTGSLRLRYFGPRDLTSDGLSRSRATLLLNTGLAYDLRPHWRLSAELLNLLNRRNDDITYAYIARIAPTASAAFTNVSHPAEPFQLRVTLEHRF